MTDKEKILAWIDKNYLWFLEAQEKLFEAILSQDAWDQTYSDEKVNTLKTFRELIGTEEARVWIEAAYTVQEVADKVDKAELRLELYNFDEITYYPPGGPLPEGKFGTLAIRRSDSTGSIYHLGININGLVDKESVDSMVDVSTGEREIPLVR